MGKFCVFLKLVNMISGVVCARLCFVLFACICPTLFMHGYVLSVLVSFVNICKISVVLTKNLHLQTHLSAAIGDTYVAVTGLPNEQPMHAILSKCLLIL